MAEKVRSLSNTREPRAVTPRPPMPSPEKPDRPRYWFPAKTYGWGWGVPCAWQGWLVLAAYLVLLPVAVCVFPPEKTLWSFVASVFALSAVLVLICWWKGEPPKWRWGEK